MNARTPKPPTKRKPFTSYNPAVAQAISDMQIGATYRLRINLADFYSCVTGARRSDTPGSEVVRELVFKPTHFAGRDERGCALIGEGVVAGERVPGVCWLLTDTRAKTVRAGIGFDPNDTRKPIGDPGMLANQWLGATSDDVRSCEVQS